MKILFFSLLFALLFANPIFANEDGLERTKKYGISFPVVELGGCSSIDECRQFCEDRGNRDICEEFARKKGLSKKRPETKDSGFWEKARLALGCGSKDACKDVCGQSENWEKCGRFAKQYGLRKEGLENKPGKTGEELLEKAKSELGCTDMDQCRQHCEKEENMDRCIEFAASHGFGDQARQFKEKMRMMKKLLGCSSMKACMDYCNNPEHSKKCMEQLKDFGFHGAGGYKEEPPEVWCPKVSNECKWDGAACVCNGPQSCGRNPECKWNGEYCQCGEIMYERDKYERYQSYDSESYCLKLPGCKWAGGQCECLASSSGQTSTDYTSVNADDSLSTDEYCKKYPDRCPRYKSTQEFEKECLEKSNCTFDGNICSCLLDQPTTGSETVSPTNSPSPSSDPKTSESVKGVKKARGLLEILRDLFF